MALMEQALYTRLSGFAGLAALVSTRIYPVRLPQNATLPAVTYQRISGVRYSAMGSDLSTASPRFQVSCWGETYLATKNVAEQVRLALQRWRGTVDGVVVQDSFLEGDIDLYEDESGPSGVYQVALDFIIHQRE